MLQTAGASSDPGHAAVLILTGVQGAERAGQPGLAHQHTGAGGGGGGVGAWRRLCRAAVPCGRAGGAAAGAAAPLSHRGVAGALQGGPAGQSAGRPGLNLSHITSADPKPLWLKSTTGAAASAAALLSHCGVAGALQGRPAGQSASRPGAISIAKVGSVGCHCSLVLIV